LSENSFPNFDFEFDFKFEINDDHFYISFTKDEIENINDCLSLDNETIEKIEKIIKYYFNI